MKKFLTLFLAMSLLLSSCASAPKEVELEVAEPEDLPALVVTDFRGEEMVFDDGFTLALDYVYGRKTSGFFYDSVNEPELFDDEGNFTGDKMLNDGEFIWGMYPTNRNFHEFRIWQSEAKSYVTKEGEAYRPHYQKTSIDEIKLKGILRYVSTDNYTGNYYAHNEWEGDLIFYPYPETMGSFPMIDLTAWPEALTIKGERSDYSSVADCPRISLGNLKKETLNLLNMELSDVEALFSDSDLIDVEIDFFEMGMAWVEEAHVEFTTGIRSITKNADL